MEQYANDKRVNIPIKYEAQQEHLSNSRTASVSAFRFVLFHFFSVAPSKYCVCLDLALRAASTIARVMLIFVTPLQCWGVSMIHVS